MNRYIVTSMALMQLFCISYLSAQVFPIDTVVLSGPNEKRINFVFLSDGYQQHELDKFIKDVAAVSSYFFSQSPLKEYKSYFNVFAIRVPSQESGASHPGTAADCKNYPDHGISVVNNYFGSSFDNSNIHRLLVPGDPSKITAVLAANFPRYDQVFILVNSPYYGGSGGSYATASVSPASNDVMLHETAHSFARVADEYGGDCTYSSLIGPNITQDTLPNLIPWNNWLDKDFPIPTPPYPEFQNGVGLFEGAYYCDTGWYRPEFNCKMRSLGAEFCRICKQTIVEKIHYLISPIESYEPELKQTIQQDSIFSLKVNLIKPEPNSIKVTWYQGSKPTGTSDDSLLIDSGKLSLGNYSFTAQINDTTLLSRDKKHLTKHIYNIVWNIIKTSGGTSVDNELISAILDVYPNPFAEKINLSVSLPGLSRIDVELIDLQGQSLPLRSESTLAGNSYQTEINLKDYKLEPGVYFLRVYANQQVIVRELIKY